MIGIASETAARTLWTSVTMAFQMEVTGGFIFVAFLVIVIVLVVAALGLRGRSRVQRPVSETTSFPPPPPPDTLMVKCAYCGTEQTWKEVCSKCGAPLPKPKIP